MVERIYKNPIEYIIFAHFGGVRSMARILSAYTGEDISPSAVSRWGKIGLIPADKQKMVLEAAQENDIDLKPNDLFFIPEESQVF